MVLNAAQKAVLAKMSKEKQEEFFRRDKERDKKEKENKKKLEDARKKEKDDYNEKWLEKYREMFSSKVIENIKLKKEISDLKFSANFSYYMNILYSGFIGASLYNIYYDYKHFIKIPKEGLKPGESYTFTMPGP